MIGITTKQKRIKCEALCAMETVAALVRPIPFDRFASLMDNTLGIIQSHIVEEVRTVNKKADLSIDAYLDFKFKGSLRMPLAVWGDRENVRDWVTLEIESILAQGVTDKKKAERWALARFDASAGLKSALIPEQAAASPGPLKFSVALGAALEAAFAALLWWNLTFSSLHVWIALAMAAALLGSRALLIATAERILALRDQRTDGRIALIAAFGILGWGIYAVFLVLPERKAQNKVIERLLADDMCQRHQANASEGGEKREPCVPVLP